VSVDVGVLFNGLHADSATTIPVGDISPEAQRLLDVTQACLAAGIEQARVGNHVGDIGTRSRPSLRRPVSAWCASW